MALSTSVCSHHLDCKVAKLEDTMQVLSARNPVEQLHFQEISTKRGEGCHHWRLIMAGIDKGFDMILPMIMT